MPGGKRGAIDEGSREQPKRGRQPVLTVDQAKEVADIYRKIMKSGEGKHKAGLEARGNDAWKDADPTVRDQIQPIGKKSGCWECGEKIEESAAVWCADHIPPWSLHNKRATLERIKAAALVKNQKPAAQSWTEWLTGKMVLLPSCKNCERSQGNLVRIVKKKGANIQNIGTSNWKLLLGG